MRVSPSPTSNPGFSGAARIAADRVQSDALVELSTEDVRPVEKLDYWREMVLRLFADV